MWYIYVGTNNMADNYQNTNIGNLNTANGNIGGNNLFTPKLNNAEQHPTSQPQNNIEQLKQNEEFQSHARLNDLDSSILESESYLNLEDETLRDEYKMSRLEKGISMLDNSIAKALEINDIQEADILRKRKDVMQKELLKLNNKYKNSDVANKLTGEISSIFKVRTTFFTDGITFIKDILAKYFLSFFSTTIRSGNEVKIALSKLQTLNKNVDELIHNQAPYGENEDKYEKLTNYLNRANIINYQISQTVKNTVFLDTINSLDFEKFRAAKNNSNFGKMTGNK